MNNIKITLFTFLIVITGGVNSAMVQTSDEILLGEISKADLQKGPYAVWYNENDTAYEVDLDTITKLDTLLEGVQVKIVMGTWCHDSKREVPRFYKILSRAQIGEDNTQMIALDRKKQAPNGEIDGLEITNTPTFIFLKDGKELNRIVEKPVESLEKDMVKILKGEKYRHSKMME